jgi:hypothetical protein
MIYQLPNGRIIYITVEQYLEMSDAEIQYLGTMDAGESAPRDPFRGSVIEGKDKERLFINDLDYEIEDDSITPGTMGNSVSENPYDDLPDDAGNIEPS